MKERKKIILFALALVLVVLSTFLTLEMVKSNPETQNKYTHTKAICDENNFCKDYEITCEKGELETMSPITGAFVQHDESWQDPRENPSKLCENHRI